MEIFFIIFALLTMVPALLTVMCRNPVNGAMFMIVSFVGLAALLVLLEAYFLAVLQILVYAGAIMVLFLFVIMLLDVEEAERVKPRTVTALASVTALALLVSGLMGLIQSDLLTEQTRALLAPAPEFAPADDPMAFATRAKAFGFGLFTKYMLPVQVTGFLLLIAMMGVIVISKKQEEPAGAAAQS